MISLNPIPPPIVCYAGNTKNSSFTLIKIKILVTLTTRITEAKEEEDIEEEVGEGLRLQPLRTLNVRSATSGAIQLTSVIIDLI
jgi:hypothetical protein